MFADGKDATTQLRLAILEHLPSLHLHPAHRARQHMDGNPRCFGKC